MPLCLIAIPQPLFGSRPASVTSFWARVRSGRPLASRCRSRRGRSLRFRNQHPVPERRTLPRDPDLRIRDRERHGERGPADERHRDFWFFSSNNVEMVAKVVNGCAFNERYWIFAGGLTNVAVNITVTDTQTGISRTYANPANTAFAPIQDTAALPTCP